LYSNTGTILKNLQQPQCATLRFVVEVVYKRQREATGNIMAPPTHGGTFQPLQHKSGALRDRLHSYTKSTLGAGGSINEAVSCLLF
jgi:hypothetical protein